MTAAPAATPPAALTTAHPALAGTDVWPWPRWVAHRGAGKLAPENTLAAFRVGAGHGFRAFECDVKLSADGRPFLLHDATLERTSNGQGTAGELPWAELARLDAGSWHSRAYAGEPLPSLDAIARYCLRNGFALNLEIKPTPGDDERTGRVVAQSVRRLWGETAAAGDSTWPLLSSFNPAALAAARLTAPELPCALLIDSLWNGWLEVAQARLGCVACVFNHALVDADLITRLHGLGLRALVYTVNRPERAAELLAWGLDGVITDAVDLMTPAR
jgi:glycerophosphoryl diester phosphodiesterase